MPELWKKKPIPVEVVQFTAENKDDLRRFIGNKGYIEDDDIVIGTLEGVVRASLGSYVVKGNEGEFWPVKESIFEKTYERAE